MNQAPDCYLVALGGAYVLHDSGRGLLHYPQHADGSIDWSEEAGVEVDFYSIGEPELTEARAAHVALFHVAQRMKAQRTEPNPNQGALPL